jgi:putative endonuclease
MVYVYVLRSYKEKNFYVGYTDNLERRIQEHNTGKVLSTRFRRPYELIYYEACRKQGDALRREKYLKTTYGKRYIRSRLRDDLTERG